MPDGETGAGKSLYLTAIEAAVIIAWAGFALWAFWIVFFDHQTWIYEEKGLIENIQALLLAVTCLIYLGLSVFGKGSYRLIFSFCSLLCYAFLLREVDAERLDLPQVLITVGSGIGRDVSITAGFAAICLYAAFKDFSRYKNAALEFAGSRSGIFLLAGGLFLIIGHVFEEISILIHHGFFEEMVELLGYVLMLLSTVARHR